MSGILIPALAWFQSLLLLSHFCLGAPGSALGLLGLSAWADLLEGVPGTLPRLGGNSQLIRAAIPPPIPIPTFEVEFSWNYPRLGGVGRDLEDPLIPIPCHGQGLIV